MTPPRYTDPFAQGDDDASLSRRDFLERTAYAAGLAGMASLPASTLISQAAQAASTSNPLPSPRNLPIDHFVFLMMENRSFDHYFGWASDFADAVKQQHFRDFETGRKVDTFHALRMDEPYRGCTHTDPGHGWEEGRKQLIHGFLAEGSGNDSYALSYYNEGELAFLHAAAKKYTLLDRYHCSLLGPTFPNRYYKYAAQSGGRKDNSLPGPEGLQFETIFDRTAKSNPSNTPGGGGPTFAYYFSDEPFTALFGPRALEPPTNPYTQAITNYYAKAEAGELENIVIVDPRFGGAEEGISGDEHPHGDVRVGQAFMADVVSAFVNSPNYRRGALFIIYDEWGGFFDHVRPPVVPDDRRSKQLYGNFGQMGFRIPAVAVSPYTRRRSSGGPRVNHGLYGHESILRMITYKFGLGHLTLRDGKANNIGHAFDFDRKDFEVPDLPDPASPLNAPCGINDRAANAQTHVDEMAGLKEYAERIGFPSQAGTPEQIFSQPDKIKKAVRDSEERERKHRQAEDKKAKDQQQGDAGNSADVPAAP